MLLRNSLVFFTCFVFFVPVLSFAQNTKWQFFNAFEAKETNDSVDIFVDGTKIFAGLGFNRASSFLSMPFKPEFKLLIAKPSKDGPIDTLFFQPIRLTFQDSFLLIVLHAPENSNQNLLQLSTFTPSSSKNSNNSVRFLNFSLNSPDLDIVLREGPMILGDLKYAQASAFIPFLSSEFFLDVKKHGTADIVGTYRLTLFPYNQQIVNIIATGNFTPGNRIQFIAFLSDGTSFELPFAPIAKVQFINLFDNTIDIYKNGTRFADNATFCSAMPFKFVPAGINLQIAISPFNSLNAFNSYANSSFVFENMKNYLAIAFGALGNKSFPLQMSFFDGAKENAPVQDQATLTFFNGYLSDSLISIKSKTATIVDQRLSFGQFLQVNIANGPLELEIKTAQNTQTFLCRIDTLLGKAIALMVVQNPSSKVLELWGVNAQGKTWRLNALTVSTLEAFDQVAVAIYPNPAHEYVQVSLSLKKDSDLNLVLVDPSGKIVSPPIFIRAQKGQISKSFKIEHLSGGTYYIIAKAGNDRFTAPLIIY